MSHWQQTKPVYALVMTTGEREGALYGRALPPYGTTLFDTRKGANEWRHLHGLKDETRVVKLRVQYEEIKPVLSGDEK